MKTNRILLLAPLVLLAVTGCQTQPAPLPVSYRPVFGSGGGEGEPVRTYAYDPYYDYSGAIFPYKDLYWYGRPPFYVKGAPLKKFESDREAGKALKKAATPGRSKP
jgi:hypothetical protein